MAEKIRVLRIINRFNLGGPTFNVAYLSKYLPPEFETKLIGGEKDDSEDTSTFITDSLGLRPEIIPEMRREISPAMDWKAYWKIRRAIREYRPHIVHTHAAKAGTLGRLAAWHENVPVILHTFHGHVFHSYFGALKTGFYKSIERFLAKRSTRIIAISNKQKFELGKIHRIAPMEKIEVVPLGFELEKFATDRETKRKGFREKYGLQDNEVAIGIIGRLVPVKNHRMFLDVVKTAVEKSTIKIRAFVIGDGELHDELDAYCENTGISRTWGTEGSSGNAVTFTSWIREVDVAYAGLDIVCLTSLNEGTPVSLIEAQAAGKPIVSTRVGGIEDIVLPGESAYLIEPNDTAGFANHLLKLVESEGLRQKMGSAGSALVFENYSRTKLVENMAALYLRLL